MDTGNTAWILTSTALVLFMTLPGLALFYAGLVRASNILSVLMHCFTIACISSIAWLVIAYSIAFSGTGAYVGDLGNLFLANLSRDSMAGDIPESVFFMFQMAAYKGYVTIHWEEVEKDLSDLFDLNNDGKVSKLDTEMSEESVQNVLSMLTHNTNGTLGGFAAAC